MQVLPTASVLPQVDEPIAKSPLAVMLPMVNAAVPVFLTVMVFAAEVAPTTVLAKVREVGVSVTAPLPLTVS